MINNMVIKKLALVLTTLLIANTALADSYSQGEQTTNFIVTPSVAYRYDVFKWSVPSDRFPDKKISFFALPGPSFYFFQIVITTYETLFHMGKLQ